MNTCPRCASPLRAQGAVLICAAFLAWQGLYEPEHMRPSCPCDYHEVRRSFSVPEQNIPRLQAKIAHLAKRAKRLGLAAPTMALGASEIRKVTRENERPIMVTFHEVTIAGESPRLNGWTFAGTVDHDGEENILRCVATVEGIPADYRIAAPTCDHCHKSRRRSETFILHNDDGRWSRVGRSCLKDFLGHQDPSSLAACAEWLAEAMEEAGSCETFEGGRAIGDPEILDFLRFVALAIREGGWVSRKAADIDGRMSTLACAQEFMYSKKSGLPKPNDADKETAEQAIEWARGISDDASEFELNLRAASKRVAVSQKNAGITAYLVAGYLKLKTERLEKKASEWVGTVGQRFGSGKGKKAIPALVLTVTHVTPHEGQYGWTYITILSDANGNKFKWFASGTCLDMGEAYTVTGTVKAHEEWKGTKQTVLSRCACEKVREEPRTEVELEEMMAERSAA